MARRVGAWMVAGAVTAALVVGGVLVARGGDARDGAGRSPAVLPALDLAAAGPAAASGKAGSDRPSVPGVTGRWPRVTYRLGRPLPSLPDRARAWKLGDIPGAGRIAGLAAALGLGAQPKQGPEGWTVRDGRRTLVVHRLAGAPFSYGSGVYGACVSPAGGGPYRPGGIQCLDPDISVTSQPGSGAGAGSTRPVRPVPPVPGPAVAPARPLPRPQLPGPAEAERVARDLAARAGLDLTGTTVKVADGYATRTVTITPAVGGLATSGFAWTVAVGAKGVVQSASGWLATPEPADTYPLIGVQEGFERLKKAPALGQVLRPMAPAVELDPCPAAAKVPCTGRPLPARVATVTGVRLGLQRAPAVARGGRPGVAYLLPAYLFDLAGGWTDVRAIVAVPDRYLTRP